jgi:hypothetical protein
MTQFERQLSGATGAGVGLRAFAATMKIGRFAFTPLFALMQEQFGISLAQGCEAVCSIGLVGRSGFGMAMGITESFPLWFLLRLLAGIASAFVLVGASVWALAHLTTHRCCAIPVARSTLYRNTGLTSSA